MPDIDQVFILVNGYSFNLTLKLLAVF